MLKVTKIISGGQVGADRGGLDFAIKYGIPHGGWCPKFRIAQDGTVPFKYRLEEAAKPGYPYRTKLNVRDSDGTVVFTTDPPGRGSSLTIQSCFDFGKPCLVITNEDLSVAAAKLKQWLVHNRIGTLNVAGSRAHTFHNRAVLVLQVAAGVE